LFARAGVGDEVMMGVAGVKLTVLCCAHRFWYSFFYLWKKETHALVPAMLLGLISHLSLTPPAARVGILYPKGSSARASCTHRNP
jgi:hypothetical protein